MYVVKHTQPQTTEIINDSNTRHHERQFILYISNFKYACLFDGV